jgi:hypothetical protein
VEQASTLYGKMGTLKLIVMLQQVVYVFISKVSLTASFGADKQKYSRFVTTDSLAFSPRSDSKEKFYT